MLHFHDSLLKNEHLHTAMLHRGYLHKKETISIYIHETVSFLLNSPKNRLHNVYFIVILNVSLAIYCVPPFIYIKASLT